MRSIGRQTTERALWRTASVILAILIPHYDSLPCNTRWFSDHEWSSQWRGWNARNPETRLLEVSPWVIVTRCLEAEEIHDNTGRPPKTLRERNVRLNDILSAQLLTRCTDPTTTFLLLLWIGYSGHGYVTIA